MRCAVSRFQRNALSGLHHIAGLLAQLPTRDALRRQSGIDVAVFFVLRAW